MVEGKNNKLTITFDQWQELVRSGANVPLYFSVKGISMQPLIRKNLDVVMVVPFKGALKKGDIVLFENKFGEPTLHRVYKLSGDTIQTLGDNCDTVDDAFCLSSVLGRAVKLFRNGKTYDLDGMYMTIRGLYRMATYPIRRRYRFLKHRLKGNINEDK